MAEGNDLVGQQAPDFCLPTADSREISLGECLARGPAVVWFSRGLGCPVCRRHRAQLTLGYPTLRDLNAEILEVTPTPVDRAAFYFSNYSLVFPYLCDPGRETFDAYGVDLHPVTIWDKAKAVIQQPLGAPALIRDDMRGPHPIPEETSAWSSDEGFFIVERTGRVRLARVGRMAGLPSKAEIEKTLRDIESLAH
jgi:peroxiredoxin